MTNEPLPSYEPYNPGGGGNPGTMVCPKCRGTMRTFDRNGVHIEQCINCRGVFLDFGELEHITQMESRYAAAPPPPPGYGAAGYGTGPEWGHRSGKHYRRKGFGGLFFSS
ncbi:MAG: zf-TFIIB domain-containing protein [Microlunatus sp.]